MYIHTWDGLVTLAKTFLSQWHLDIESRDVSGWKRPQKVSSPTSSSWTSGWLWTLSTQVLRTSMGWERLFIFSGQPVLLPEHPHLKKDFATIKLSFEVMPIMSCPCIMHHCEEPGSISLYALWFVVSGLDSKAASQGWTKPSPSVFLHRPFALASGASWWLSAELAPVYWYISYIERLKTHLHI